MQIRAGWWQPIRDSVVRLPSKKPTDLKMQEDRVAYQILERNKAEGRSCLVGSVATGK